MKKKILLLLRLFIYSLRHNLSVSKLGVILYFTLSALLSSVLIVSVYLLNIIIDFLVSGGESILLYALFMFLCVVASVVLSKIRDFIYGNITRRTYNKFENIFMEKMQYIPVDTLDSSAGLDYITYARCANEEVVLSLFNILDIIANIWAFAVALSVSLKFSVCFTMLFLVFTLPGAVMNILINGEKLIFNKENAPSQRKRGYYRWILTGNLPAKM